MRRPVALEPFRVLRGDRDEAPAAEATPDPAAPGCPAPHPAPDPAPEPAPEPEAERLERLGRICAALEAVAADQAALSARWISAAADAFGVAAERVLPRLARAGFARTVAESVDALSREARWPRLELAAAAAEAAEIEAAVSGAGPTAIAVRTDPGLAPGEVRLGWDGGGAEIDAEALAEAALERLRRALATSADQGA